jgi:hypothetical protein
MDHDTAAFVVVTTAVRFNMTPQGNLLAHIPLRLHGNPITVEMPQRFAESRTPTANREWSRVIRLSLLADDLCERKRKVNIGQNGPATGVLGRCLCRIPIQAALGI